MRKKEDSRNRVRDRGGGTAPVKVTVTQWRKRDRLVWAVIVGSGTGKGRRHVETCSSREEAEELKTILVAKIRAGALVETEEPPARVGELLERYLDIRLADPGVRQSTKKNYAFLVKALKSGLGGNLLEAFSRYEVRDYVEMRLGDGRSPETVGNEVAALRMAFRVAGKKKWWQGDPDDLFSLVDLDPVPEKRWLRREEVPPLLEQIRDPCMLVAVKLALEAGLRAGEVITRQWRDLDRLTGLLTIGPKSGIGWQWKTKNGKTRKVGLSKALRDELATWWETLGRPGGEGWIVPTRDGERRRVTNPLNDAVRAACVAAGIEPPVTFHGLRHSCASLALEAGESLPVIAKMLGHHSPAFTAKQYAHVDDQRMVDVAERLRTHFSTPKRSARAATKPATLQPE